MPFVTVGGLKIHYVTGLEPDPARGPTVVFVHGAGGTHEHWRFQIRTVGLNRNAVAVDLPGHGESQGDGYARIGEYRDFLCDLLDALRAPRVALVGHSMGGGIALSFALAHPDRLAALVLVGTGAKLRVHPEIFAAIRRDLVEAARLVSEWAYSQSSAPATVALAAEAFSRNRSAVLEADFSACDAFDAMNDLAAITTPTLVMCGEDDRLTPVKYARYLHERIPGASLFLVPGAGHMVMLERPNEVNQALTAFLDAHAAGGEKAVRGSHEPRRAEDLRQAIQQMCADTAEMLRATWEGFRHGDGATLEMAARQGKAIHRREKELTDEVVNSWHTFPEEVRDLLFIPTHLERIGDNVENLVRCIQMIRREGIRFPEPAVGDVSTLFEKAIHLLGGVRDLLPSRNRILMRYVVKGGEELQALADEYAQTHQERLIRGECLPGASSSFLAILDYLKGIEWHTRRIVQKMTERKLVGGGHAER